MAKPSKYRLYVKDQSGTWRIMSGCISGIGKALAAYKTAQEYVATGLFSAVWLGMIPHTINTPDCHVQHSGNCRPEEHPQRSPATREEDFCNGPKEREPRRYTISDTHGRGAHRDRPEQRKLFE